MSQQSEKADTQVTDTEVCEWCCGAGHDYYGDACTHCEVSAKLARDALWVMNELDSGQWKLIRSNPGSDLTEEYARENAWFVQRELGPFTGKSGARVWHGPTAKVALMRARKDLFGEDIGEEPIEIWHRVEPEFMDFEFVGGHTVDDPDGKFWAGIHVGPWMARIMVWGNTPQDAELLRDRLLQAVRAHFPENNSEG